MVVDLFVVGLLIWMLLSLFMLLLWFYIVLLFIGCCWLFRLFAVCLCLLISCGFVHCFNYFVFLVLTGFTVLLWGNVCVGYFA